MHYPSKRNWKAVKWILRYLLKTVDIGLAFEQDNTLSHCIIGFIDFNYASDLDMHRSTNGYVFTLARVPISHKSIL